LRALELHEKDHSASKFKKVLSIQLAYVEPRMVEIDSALLRVFAHETLVPAAFVLSYSAKKMLAVGWVESQAVKMSQRSIPEVALGINENTYLPIQLE
jgi:hypothetical protein